MSQARAIKAIADLADRFVLSAQVMTHLLAALQAKGVLSDLEIDTIFDQAGEAHNNNKTPKIKIVDPTKGPG